jgi:hypothetical protein
MDTWELGLHPGIQRRERDTHVNDTLHKTSVPDILGLHIFWIVGDYFK